MPVFSFIYVCIVLILFLNYRNKKKLYINLLILTCAIEINHFQGGFLGIGAGYSFSTINRYILLIYSFYYLFTTVKCVKYNYLIYSVLLFILPIFMFLYNNIFAYSGGVIPDSYNLRWDAYVANTVSMITGYTPEISSLRFGILLIINFVVGAYLIKSTLYLDDIYYIADKTINILKVTVFYGVIEFFVKNILVEPLIIYEFLGIVFGYDERAHSVPRLRNDFFSLQGFTREESFFVVVLFTIILLIIIINKIRQNRGEKYKNMFTLFVSIILMFLSGGVSAIWYGFVLLVSFLLIRYSNIKINIYKLFIRVLPIAGILLGIIFFANNSILELDTYVFKRIYGILSAIDLLIDNRVVILAGVDGSAVARFTSLIEGFKTFMDFPWTGYGFGILVSFDATIAMLEYVGIIGMILWILILNININAQSNVSCDNKLLLIAYIVAGIPLGFQDAFWCIHVIIIMELTKIYKCRYDCSSV